MAKTIKRTISWNPSTAADVKGYKLYWAQGADAQVDYLSDNMDVGNVTQIIIPDYIPNFPLIDDMMTIGITAYDDVGNESDMTILSNVPFDFTAPDAPTNLVVGVL
jgi:hypothetical protein